MNFYTYVQVSTYAMLCYGMIYAISANVSAASETQNLNTMGNVLHICMWMIRMYLHTDF